MSSMDDVNYRRVATAEDNFSVTPLDLLKMLVRDIEEGKEKMDSVLVIWVERHDPQRPQAWTIGAARSCLHWYEEMTLAENQKLSAWKNSSK